MLINSAYTFKRKQKFDIQIHNIEILNIDLCHIRKIKSVILISFLM